jgi:hypothetical protein
MMSGLSQRCFLFIRSNYKKSEIKTQNMGLIHMIEHLLV